MKHDFKYHILTQLIVFNLNNDIKVPKPTEKYKLSVASINAVNTFHDILPQIHDYRTNSQF